MSLDFQSSADEDFYKEWRVQKRLHIENPGQRVKNLSEYYLEILWKLRDRKGMDPELAPFWEFVIKIYEEMFQHLFSKK